MSSDHDREDYGPWVPLAPEEMAGPERIVTEDELDLRDLVQHYGAVASDPLSIAQARGRREVERPAALERIQAEIRTAEVHVAYGRRDSGRGSTAGSGNRGRRAWHTEALEALLLELDAEGRKAGAVHRLLVEAFDDPERSDDLLDAMNRATGKDLMITDFWYEYRSKPGNTPLFRLERGDGVSRLITSRMFQNAVAELSKK